MRRGLGYDRADVAVITNITADHLGDDEIDDIDELIHVKALVAEEIADGAALVLNADDPATATLADRAAVRRHDPVLSYSAWTRPVLSCARTGESGGLCYELADGQLTETERRGQAAAAERGRASRRVRRPGQRMSWPMPWRRWQPAAPSVSAARTSAARW